MSNQEFRGFTGPPRTGWIVAVDEKDTPLGFVPKEADKLGNLPITVEIGEALVVRYSPSGTECGTIQALNPKLRAPYSAYPCFTNEPTFLSASWFSPVKPNEQPELPNFASLSFGTAGQNNKLVGSWTNCSGPTYNKMWKVDPDASNIILPHWPTEDQ
ncbi:hypothetical protein FRB90_000638, partial [Tulasnella sp. 427]